ncbi:MAG: TetR/AcrR family transcriptional regulator [Thalassotalea sp.]
MRDSESTRNKILAVTSDEIHKNGFNNTSLATILKRCEISKGALYHHFENKIELGYAVFEEVYTPNFLNMWRPALTTDDPIEGLCNFFQNMTTMSCEDVVCGCPLNNLCQEMSSIDEGFRIRILSMQQQLNQLLVNAFKSSTTVLKDELDYSQVAYFIVSVLNGSTGLSKSTQDKHLFVVVINELCNYLRSLKK